MKRIIIFVLTAVILLSMGGCTKKKADNTVEVFCLNMDVTSSVPESYVLRSKNSDVDKQVDELLGRMQDKPEDSRLRKAIPDEVSVRGHEEKNYNCTVDFSKEYYDLTAAQEVLLRASVVRTLTQLDSISYVTFTVNSIPLVDSDDEIYENSLEVLITRMTDGIDMVTGGYVKCNPQGDVISDVYEMIDHTFTMSKFAVLLSKPIYFEANSIACIHLFKRSIIEEYHLRFNEKILFCEDTPFIAEYLLYQIAGITNTNLAIGGTGLLIVVSVGLETLRQINSRALMVTYDDYDR